MKQKIYSAVNFPIDMISLQLIMETIKDDGKINVVTIVLAGYLSGYMLVSVSP